jgi:hypothetical protein
MPAEEECAGYPFFYRQAIPMRFSFFPIVNRKSILSDKQSLRDFQPQNLISPAQEKHLVKMPKEYLR